MKLCVQLSPFTFTTRILSKVLLEVWRKEGVAKSTLSMHTASENGNIRIESHCTSKSRAAATDFHVLRQSQRREVRILIDSGAKDDFISEKFAMEARVPVTTVPEVEIKMADGTSRSSRLQTSPIKVSVLQTSSPPVSFVSSLRLAPLHSGYDVLLGEQWLAKHGVRLCYDSGALYLPKYHRVLTPGLQTSWKMDNAIIPPPTKEDVVGVAIIRATECPQDRLQQRENEQEALVDELKTEFKDIL